MGDYKKIAVAIDYSEQSLKALDRAIVSAKENDAILLLVNVIDTVSFGSVAAYDLKYAAKLKAESETKIEELKKKALEAGVSNVETLVAEGAAKGILTELPDVDLIICGATGVNKVEKMVLGSVAERILRSAQYDVLLVR